jgi:MFS family permease
VTLAGGTTSSPARSPGRVVAGLAASNALLWLGAGSILPLLPLYLRRHGAPDGMVGAIMAAFFVAALVVQVPVGRLADRVGRRPVQLAGLLVSALGSGAFLLAAQPGFALAFRALQGMGTGAVQVASAAVIGDVVPEGRRGQAYGALYGGEIGGLAIGPLVGTLVSAGHMTLIFAAATVLSGVATLPVLFSVPGHRALRQEPERPSTRPWRSRGVLGVALAMGASGLVSGMYEVCWSLLLHLRGASTAEIGLSWTLFAAPFVLAVKPAGWLADHLDRRALAMVAVLGSAGFAALYPFLPGVPWLLGMGTAEALTVSVGYPAVMAELAHLVPSGTLGEAQGFVAAAQTGAIALAAGVSGALFGLHPWLPYLATAGTMVLAVALLPVLWRRPVAQPAEAG